MVQNRRQSTMITRTMGKLVWGPLTKGVKTRTAHTPKRRRLGFPPHLGVGAYININILLLFYHIFKSKYGNGRISSEFFIHCSQVRALHIWLVLYKKYAKYRNDKSLYIQTAAAV